MKDDDSNRLKVEGDRNQVIAANYGPAFANVEGDVFLHQSPPKALSLHQLEADIADFTGRKDEIEGIRGHLKRGETVAISAVAGMPGVGKSALAIHVAHQLKTVKFPDVQLYIDLRGADGNALEPTDVLAQWLRAFGLDQASIPKNVRERSSVFRSLLSGKRAIIVLDNARDEAQVRPLLPGSQTCAVIVTSRRVLGALEGATIVHLEVLPEPESLELLERLIGAARVQQELAAAQEIVQLCGRLPLAIRIVGGALNMKRHWKLSDYTQRLADEKKRLSHLKLSDLDVRASFELSYRELNNSDAELFYHLGILEGKEFGPAFAGMLIRKESNAGDGLERLVDAQLIEAHEGHRYQFHDLIRVFAREKLGELVTSKQQESTKQKIVDYLTEWSAFMSYFLTPKNRQKIIQDVIKTGENPSSVDEQISNLTQIALNSMAQEREHLLSALHWANDLKRWDVVINLAANLVNFFDTTSYWQEGEQSCLVAIAASQNAGNLQGEAAMHNNLGALYQTQSRWEEAIISYQKSLRIKRALNDRHGEGQTLNNLGNVYSDQGRWDEAIDCFQRNLEICKNFKDQLGEGVTLMNLGGVYNSQRQWKQAIDHYQTSLQIMRALGDQNGEGKVLGQLGDLYRAQGRWDKAINCLQKGLEIKKIFGDRHGKGIILNTLAAVYQAKGQLDKAIDYYEQSLDICQVLNDTHGQAQVLNNLGILYDFQDQWDKAIDCYQKSLKIKQALGDHLGEGSTLGNLGNVCRNQGQWNQAIIYYQQSLKISRAFDNFHEESTTLMNLGIVYTFQHRWEVAIDYYQKSLAIYRTLGDQYGEGQVIFQLGLMAEMRGQRVISLTFLQEALTKIPPDAPDYQTVVRLLSNVQNSKPQ